MTRQFWDPVAADLERAAAEIRVLAEDGSHEAGDLPEAILDRMVRRGLLRLEETRVDLTPQGERLAAGRLRRVRLAELLLFVTLEPDADGPRGESCSNGAFLREGVTGEACALLGHPAHCPHSRPIPRGACCEVPSDRVEPLLRPLSRLAAGQSGRVVYVAPGDPGRLVRLSNLGIVPGATVRLHQKRPAVVLHVGETSVAVDSAVSDDIFVSRA